MENYSEEYDVYDDIMEEPLDWWERPIEPLGEMATVYTCNKPSIRIQVNPDPNRIGSPYFKVYDNESFHKATKVARLHFLDTSVEYHRDRFKDWIMSKKEIKMVKDILNKKHDDFNKYTNWDICKWLWNVEYSFISNTKSDREKYMNGEFDEKFKDHPSYVPSSIKIPDTWKFK